MVARVVDDVLPKRWDRLKQMFLKDGWALNRVSGSHHIFTKPGRRCIPLAFHGGTVAPGYAALVLRQAGISASRDDDDLQLEWEASTAIESDHNVVTRGEEAVHESDKIIPVKKERRIKNNCHEKSEFIVGKAERDKADRQRRQDEQLRGAFQRLEIDKDEARRARQEERHELLEKAQGLVAIGEYESALDSLSSINISGDLGSSAEDYNFNCDVLFYRTMAISEHAFSSSVAFNSKAQQEKIDEALSLVIKFMKSCPERRQEGRELARNLQNRVVAEYLSGLMNINFLYIRADMTAIQKRNGLNPDAGVFSFIDTFVGSQLPLKDPTNPTKEEVFGLMDQVADGFDFVVSITARKEIPFAAALQKSSMTELTLVDMTGVCLRRMLVSFDRGDYADVTRLSETLSLFTARHGGVMKCHSLISKPITPPCAMITDKLLLGIASHVQSLLPIYKFAKKQMKWHRIAGVLAEEAPSVSAGYCTSFDDLVLFIDEIIKVFANDKKYLEDLVVSNLTRRFVFDTFSDPVLLACNAMERALFEDKSISNRVLGFLKQHDAKKEHDQSCTFDSVLLDSPSLMKEFRKSRYDQLRVNSVRLYSSLMRVVRLFDDLLALDPRARMKMFEVEWFVRCRFELLPKVLWKLNMLLKLTFGPAHFTSSMLQQIIVLQTDLDIAEHYYLEIGDGKAVGQGHLAGGLKSPEAVKASGLWSFTLVFNIFARSFLGRLALGDEWRELLVIDAVSDEQIIVARDGTGARHIEALAFETLSMLSDLTSGEVPAASAIEDLLLSSVLRRPQNQSWCHHFKGDGERKRWAKDKARKFSRLISRFWQGLGGMQVESCLAARKEGVDYLMEMLRESIKEFRKLPRNFVVHSRDEANMVRAANYVKQWSREELHLIRMHLLQLEGASEKATSFFHVHTGGAFPEVKSVVNPAWTMGESRRLATSEFSTESCMAIREMMYVHAVVQEFIQSRGCSTTSK